MEANDNEIHASTKIYGNDLKSTWWKIVAHTTNKANDGINDRYSGFNRTLLDIEGGNSMTTHTHQQTNHQSCYGVSHDIPRSEWNQICEVDSETLCSKPIVRRQNKKQQTEHQLINAMGRLVL
jgi:hypothetical protein